MPYKNPEKHRECKARWRANNPDYQTRYRAANRKKFREYKTRYRTANPEKRRAQVARYRAANRNKINAYHAGYLAKNPNRRLSLRICIAVNKSLRYKKQGRHWETLVGYTLADLMAHLKARFLSGMTWENMGRGGGQVDHIIPVSAFNFERAEDVDFKRCWALSNLQPLWESDNLSKGARLKAPFQPSLKLRIQGPKHTPRNAQALCDSKRSGIATP